MNEQKPPWEESPEIEMPVVDNPTEALQTLNILGKLFPPPPYNCEYRRDNPDLVELQEPTYREDFEELKSTKSAKPLGIYQREIGEYDDYETETLTYDEWQVYGNRPIKKINKLREEIHAGMEKEKEAGIHHYSRQSDWVQASFQVPVPELKFDMPEQDSSLCDPKTCEKHYHCIYCFSTKVTHETFSDWYKCRSCHKEYEESEVEAFQNG